MSMTFNLKQRRTFLYVSETSFKSLASTQTIDLPLSFLTFVSTSPVFMHLETSLHRDGSVAVCRELRAIGFRTVNYSCMYVCM